MPAAAMLRRKDVLGGVLVCALGAGAVAMVRGNAIGTLGRMGPGFFPTLVGDYGGLLPATFAVVFIAALADRDNTWRSALTLAASMVAVCLVVFWWALQVQFPLLTIGPDW